MTKGLFIATILVLLTLTACAEPTQRDTPAPTANLQPTATEANSTTRTTPATIPDIPTPPASVTSTAAPQPVAIPAIVPTFAPELTATVALGPTPTPIATAVPTPTAPPTQQPAPIPAPTVADIPTPEPTATAIATQTPAPTPVPGIAAGTWPGIIVAAENRCSQYDSGDYPYSASVEHEIAADLGGIYGPYTGTWFESIKETDIEHIVARSEAHDSGLCSATPETRKQFASDLLNLKLASPSVNRHQKSDHDAAEWLPALNQCWYVDRVIQVRLEDDLTIDRSEAEAIDQVLAGCPSTEMVILDPGESASPTPTAAPSGDVDALALYDDNGNGRITCSEARAHGIAPLRRGDPAYQYMRDADGDGVVCE